MTFYNRFLWPTYNSYARNNREIFNTVCNELDKKYDYRSPYNNLIYKIDKYLFDRKINYEVTEKIKNLLYEKFNESNQRLNEKYNIEL